MTAVSQHAPRVTYLFSSMRKYIDPNPCQSIASGHGNIACLTERTPTLIPVRHFPLLGSHQAGSHCRDPRKVRWVLHKCCSLPGENAFLHHATSMPRAGAPDENQHGTSGCEGHDCQQR
eukprot:scaffold106577_cov45-Prasinocladus_malaysianus.AAC.2